jgi:hypothetical protein
MRKSSPNLTLKSGSRELGWDVDQVILTINWIGARTVVISLSSQLWFQKVDVGWRTLIYLIVMFDVEQATLKPIWEEELKLNSEFSTAAGRYTE